MGMLPSRLAYFLPVCNVQEFARSSSRSEKLYEFNADSPYVRSPVLLHEQPRVWCCTSRHGRSAKCAAERAIAFSLVER